MADASKESAAPPRLTLGNVGYMLLIFCTMMIGSINDYNLSENSNFIPVALHFTNSQWGDLVGGYSLYIRGALCVVLCGQLIDNFPLVRSIAIILFISAVASILFPVTDTFGAWLALRFLYTIGGASFYILSATLGMVATPEPFHGLAAGLTTAGANGSDLLAIALERIFTTTWRGSFYVATGLMAALGLICLFVPEVREREKKPLAVICREICDTYRLFSRVLVTSIAPWCLVICLAGQGFMYATTTLTQQWLVQDLGKNATDVADIMLAMPAVQLLGALATGVMGDINKSRGIPFWATNATAGVIGVAATLAMTHIDPNSGWFWFFVVIQQSVVIAPSVTMVPGFIPLLPMSLWGTAFGLGYGSFTLFFGLGTKIAQDQSEIWTAEHATLNGHPAAFTYGFLLMAYLALMQVPFAALGVWALKHDREKVQRAVAEANPLLESKTGPLLEANDLSASGCCGVICGV